MEKAATNVVDIETERLCKVFPHRDKYGNATQKIAVQNLSLHVHGGEIFGLLGTNGAGKTTTIRIMTMQTGATSGAVRYGGLDTQAHAQQIKNLIGVVPQHINFDQDLTVGENMELHARLHHMRQRERTERIAELLDYAGLSEVTNDGGRRLSGGMKRRLLIVRALLHRPRVLFLDEPTVALDPQVRRRIWDLIHKMASDGVTVFLTTHYIEEAEVLCQHVAILSKGRLVATGTPQELREHMHKTSLEEVFLALAGKEERTGKEKNQ